LISCLETARQWGIFTGAFFGVAWLPSSIQPLVPWLADMNNVMFFCFFIAAIHLTIAHFWRVILKFPSSIFLSDVGWIALVWTMFFAANMFVLNHPFPSFGRLSLIGGCLLIIFFTKPNINPLKAIGSGLAELAMNFVNSFTDVISYIRLFAVGLATVAIADAFNEMAMGVGFNSVLTGIGASRK